MLSKKTLLQLEKKLKDNTYILWAEDLLSSSGYDAIHGLEPREVLFLVKDFIQCRLIELEAKENEDLEYIDTLNNN